MEIIDRMKLQCNEFNAAVDFSEALKTHNSTAIVDDDYPEVRHNYEIALGKFINAMKENGRFNSGNIYGLEERMTTKSWK